MSRNRTSKAERRRAKRDRLRSRKTSTDGLKLIQPSPDWSDGRWARWARDPLPHVIASIRVAVTFGSPDEQTD